MKVYRVWKTQLWVSPLLHWWNSSRNQGDTLDFFLYRLPKARIRRWTLNYVPRHALILTEGKVFQLFFSDKNSWHLLASWGHKGLSYLSSVEDSCQWQCSYSRYIKNPLWCFSFRNTLKPPWILTASVSMSFALNCKEHLLSADIWEGHGFWAQRLPAPCLPLAGRSYSQIPFLKTLVYFGCFKPVSFPCTPCGDRVQGDHMPLCASSHSSITQAVFLSSSGHNLMGCE